MRNHFLVDRLLPDAVDGPEQAGLFVDKREFAQSALPYEGGRTVWGVISTVCCQGMRVVRDGALAAARSRPTVRVRAVCVVGLLARPRAMFGA